MGVRRIRGTATHPEADQIDKKILILVDQNITSAVPALLTLPI